MTETADLDLREAGKLLGMAPAALHQRARDRRAGVWDARPLNPPA